ncbi:MAG: ParB N-terminal domain-containing protein [Litoreibacter sp.]
MSKKRRVFDIDFEDTDGAVPAGTAEKTDTRRGPMATAITENADALANRQDAEAAIRAENDALAHEHVRLKKAGLITDLIALDEIRTDKLTRDRKEGRDDEIDELKASIREIGLSNPIRVEKGDHGYELIQGFRRLTAFKELLIETEDQAFAKIPAGISSSGEDVTKLYRRMVDENLVRRGVTFGEMAQLAMAYRAEDPNVESYDHAVELLFASSGRQKRSYIKSFVRLLNALDPHLRHVDALSRSVGLAVLKRVENDPDQLKQLCGMLTAQPDRSVEDELRVTQAFLAEKPSAKPKTEVQKTAKTTFRMTRPEGVAKCTAADGRLELRLDRDFSGVERRRLEAAIAAFFNTLDR